jgi:uncharacterized sporulation protein YeaH/YhbH (DUF444 family)
MSNFIDRRVSSKNKSTVNRQRFLKRYKSQLKRAVSDAVNRRSITDVDAGEKVGIPNKDTSEPTFRHDRRTGRKEMIHPGNKEFETGDRVLRPEEGSGGGSGQGGPGKGGKGEDDFVFELSREEFLDLLFDDLELPNLLRNQLIGTTEFKTVRAGTTTDGAPSHIDIVRSMKWASARRRVIGASKLKRVRELEEEIDALLNNGVAEDDERIVALREEISRLRKTYCSAAVHRHLRPALPVVHQAAGADQQGRDGLHHGRVRLHGSGAQEPGQALLHSVVLFPAAELRQDRRCLHPPSHHRPRGG